MSKGKKERQRRIMHECAVWRGNTGVTTEQLTLHKLSTELIDHF